MFGSLKARAFLLPLTMAIGCGGDANSHRPDAEPPGSPDADVPELASIVVLPSQHRFIAESGVADTRIFAATGIYDDGSMRDLSDVVTWDSYNPSLVSVNSDGFATSSTQLAGETQVVARIGSMNGTSDVTIVQRRVVIGLGAPANAAELFDNAALDGATGRAPSIFYPYANTVLPPNFAGLELHYLAGQGNDLYEISMEKDFYEFKTYTACAPLASGCWVVPNAAGWNDMAQRMKGGDLEIVVSGLQESNPSTKGVSTPRAIKLTSQDLTAGLYYWAATDGRIHRFDFGASGVAPEPWYPAVGDGDCAACHSLSRDGTLIAVDRGSGVLELIDVATKTELWELPLSSPRTAFSPDNTRLLSTMSLGSSTGLSVIDVTTGLEVATSITASSADAPDWSPDGSLIAWIQSGSVWLTSYDAATDTFGDSFQLQSASDAANPAFTPDSQFVIFNKGTNLYVLPVGAPPGTAPRLLGAAQGGYDGNTWLKMAPSMLPYEDGEVAFMTWSSLRPIGLRTNVYNQIFFAAFDPARAAADLDGSFSAVHLPWQSLTNGNHIAQWATDIVHEPCGPRDECPEEFECEKGECVPIID